MFYLSSLTEFPEIKSIYRVTRNTVWQICATENMLIFIEDGECEIEFSGKAYKLKRGDVFFVPERASYLRRPTNGGMCTMTYIHFTSGAEFRELDFSEITKDIADTKNDLDNLILGGVSALPCLSKIYMRSRSAPDDFKKILGMINSMRMFSARRQLMCGLHSTIALCNILALLSQNTIDSLSSDIRLNEEPIIAPNLKRAIQYIVNHHTEKISLDDLAVHCHISKQQLIRYFKSSFNTTPISYITDYKISRAKELLFNHPELTVKEISSELGFDNQHYFARVFAKITGETPSAYRERTVNYGKKDREHTPQKSGKRI